MRNPKSVFSKYMKTRDESSSHAVLSASGSERWLGCPASVNLSKGREQIAHESAQVGTNAHTLLQFILENKNWYQLLLKKEADKFKKFIDYSQEQFDSVLTAVTYIFNERDVMGDPEFYVEQKLELESVGFGTADVILYKPFGTLHIMDYKNGKYKVEPEDNTQMLYYAVAAADKFGWDFRDVLISIIQPNAPHEKGVVRTWKTTPERLERAKLMFKRGAEATRKKNPAVIPNNKYCWFCAAKPVCPAQMKQREEKIMEKFNSENRPKHER